MLYGTHSTASGPSRRAQRRRDDGILKPNLKSIFFHADRRLRNGWWILVFLGFIALTRFAYKPLTHGLRSLGLGELGLEPVPFLLTLLATWGCTRLRGEPLSSVGYRLDRRWFGEIASGTLVGMRHGAWRSSA